MAKKQASSDNANLERWLKAADGLDGSKNPLKVPYDVALQEAAGLARFVRANWEATSALPGMKQVASRLPLSTADDIVSLVAAIGEQQTKLLLLVDPVVVKIGERARFVVGELESAIAFTLDDDVHEPADDQLAQLQEFHAQDGQRSSALAQALRDFSALAASLKKRIEDADEGFEPGLIDEATKLATSLDAEAADPAAAKSPAAKDAAAARNQLLALLEQKKALVRKAGAHVYRAHPEVVRQLTSAYDRKRRTALRKKKAAAPAPAAAPAT